MQLLAPTDAPSSAWLPAPPANRGAQQLQLQLQGSERTPAPVGAKRKFVASPPHEAVSPLFSTPGEFLPLFSQKLDNDVRVNSLQ